MNEKTEKINKKGLAFILVGFFAFAGLIIFFNFKETYHPNQIEIDDYVMDVSYGLNGYGGHRIDGINKTFIQKYEDIENEKLFFLRNFSIKKFQYCMSAMDYSREDYHNLKNDDQVTYEIINTDKKCGFIKPTRKTFTVSNLPDPIILSEDDFKDRVEMTFSGLNGEGTADVSQFFEMGFSSQNFEIENNTSLSNGDMVTLSFLKKDVNDSLSQFGYLIEDDIILEYEVEGLNGVYEDITEIKNLDEIIEAIEKKAIADGNFQKPNHVLNQTFYSSLADFGTYKAPGVIAKIVVSDQHEYGRWLNANLYYVDSLEMSDDRVVDIDSLVILKRVLEPETEDYLIESVKGFNLNVLE